MFCIPPASHWTSSHLLCLLGSPLTHSLPRTHTDTHTPLHNANVSQPADPIKQERGHWRRWGTKNNSETCSTFCCVTMFLSESLQLLNTQQMCVYNYIEASPCSALCARNLLKETPKIFDGVKLMFFCLITNWNKHILRSNLAPPLYTNKHVGHFCSQRPSQSVSNVLVSLCRHERAKER